MRWTWDWFQAQGLSWRATGGLRGLGVSHHTRQKHIRRRHRFLCTCHVRHGPTIRTTPRIKRGQEESRSPRVFPSVPSYHSVLKHLGDPIAGLLAPW